MKIEQNVCRLCAESITDDNVEYIDNIIRRKILELFKIKILLTNPISTAICFDCSNNVNGFHTFFKKILNAQKCFTDKTYLAPEIKIEGHVKNIYNFNESLKYETNDATIIPTKRLEAVEPSIQFDSENKIQYDQSTKHEEIRMINRFYNFECPKCQVKLQTSKMYRKHMKIRHAEKRARILCCKTFIEVTHLSLLGHIYSHNEPEKLKCVPCDKQYNTLKSLSQHIRKVHSFPIKKKEEHKVFCPECGILLEKLSLQNHLKTHQPRVKFQCDICQKSRKAILYHMTQQHLPKNPSIDQFLCNICAKSFDTKNRFSHHLRYHHDDKTAKCPDCNVVMRLANLRVHRKRVHEIKKVTCSICFKEFKNNDRLRGHKIKVHVEPKFACDICLKKYKTKDKMQEHRSTHFNELRFKCDLCDHMNNDYGNMTKHRKTKHRDVAYPAPGTARKIFEMARR